MKITLDENEEILAIADSYAELADLVGVKPTTILEEISRAKRKGWRCSYIRILDDEEI